MANGHDRIDDQTSGGGFVTGLLTGAVIGAGLGVLFAPRAGADMREGMADFATSARRAVTNKYRDTSEAVGETIDELAGRGRKAYDQARKVVSPARLEIARATDEAMKRVQNVASAVNELAAKEVAMDGRRRA